MGTLTLETSSTFVTECPACGSISVTEREQLEEFEYGAGKDHAVLQAIVPVCTCSQCGTQFTDERAERSRHASICRHLIILEPAQITAIRERYRATQVEFAEISRIGRASLARWETGAIYQNGSIDNLMYLLGFPENFERLKDRFSSARACNQEPSNPSKRHFRCLTEKQMASMKLCSSLFELHPEH